MLTIGKLGRGQERYYLEKVAEGAEDYYSGEGEAGGVWIGDAAADLGLSGEVGDDQLTALLTGRSPVDGEPLVGMRGVSGNGAVPGFDLTFSLPKSASLLWALGSPETKAAVTTAHESALEAALGYLQREACWTRRGAGGAEFVKGNGYLASAFRHRSSRAGDPQVHVHVLVANATKGPDGRWTRLYHPAIYEHAKTAGYLFEAHFRHELTQRLGVRWQEVRNGIAEIDGFADEHLRAFSTRRAEILEAAGPDASARARQVANLTTREAKENVSTPDLFGRWRSKAKEIGLDCEAIERGFDPQAPAVARTVSTQQVDRAVTAGVSHFDRRDVVQAVAELQREGAPAAEVEQLADVFLASDAVVQLGETAKGERFTTKRIWELEREALATAERMRVEGASNAGELIAARVIGSRPSLKDDQREMVRPLLAEREGVVVVIGEAGTGKTYAIVAAAEGWAQAGIELRAAAPTWRAANVMRDEGLPASSIVSLLAELDREGSEGLASGSILLVDEAGMVDSATLARLIAHADAADAKLVLVGDPQQLGEIEAGGLFAALAERSEPIYLNQVIRHKHDLDREAAKCIREGRGAEALNLYRSEERVIVAPNAEARREAMISDWHGAFARGEDAVMIAKRNVEVERLNEQARAVLREAGRLGTEEIQIGGAPFAASDQVITRVNDRGAQVYNRERWQIAEVDAERRSVILDGIDQDRRVELDAAYLAKTGPHSEAPALQHAYAVTTYSAQGTTVDRAFIAADPSMDKQELYVAASRSRGETYLYATPEIQVQREEFAPRSPYLRDGIPHIVEAAERDRAQLAAHDVAQLEALPTPELVARRSKLLLPAGDEQRIEERRDKLQREIGEITERLDRIQVEREISEALPSRKREADSGYFRASEAMSRQALEAREAEVRALSVEHGARAELAAVEQVLAARRQLAVTAARIAPPDYIRRELGERPSDPAKRKAWDRGVDSIERYRQEHGIKDRDRALGHEPKRSTERAVREQAQRRLRQVQRELGKDQGLARTRRVERSLGIGR